MDAANFPQGPGLHFGDRSLIRKQEGAWIKVMIGTPDGRAGCYYRKSTPVRFLVSDLGDGIRALRKRTGLSAISLKQEDEILTAVGDHSLAVGMPSDPLDSCCDAVELPGIICRVLLASHRVANLEIGEEST